MSRYKPAVHAGLPSFVWQTPAADKLACEIWNEQYGDDLDRFEEELIQDKIDMYIEATAAQQCIIPQLADALSQHAVVNCLGRVLSSLEVPATMISNIGKQVMGLGCLWADAFPAAWVEPPAEEPAQTKHCSCCIVEEQPIGSGCTSSSSDASSTGSSNIRCWFVRCSKVMAGASAAAIGMLARRHNLQHQ